MVLAKKVFWAWLLPSKPCKNGKRTPSGAWLRVDLKWISQKWERGRRRMGWWGDGRGVRTLREWRKLVG